MLGIFFLGRHVYHFQITVLFLSKRYAFSLISLVNGVVWILPLAPFLMRRSLVFHH